MPFEKALYTVLPTAAGFSSPSNRTTGSIFTPTKDMTINALYVGVSGTNVAGLAPYIYDLETQALVASGPALPTQTIATNVSTKLPLTNPVTLLAGKQYVFAFYASSSYSVGRTALSGTYTIDEGYGLTTIAPPSFLRVYTGIGFPGASAGFNYHLTAGVSVLVPSTPDPVFVSGFVQEAKSPLVITYNIEDPDNNTQSLAASIGETVLFTETNPVTNVDRVLDLTSVWASLQMGVHTLQLAITDKFGKVHINFYKFTKLVPDGSPLIPAVESLHVAIDIIQTTKAAIKEAVTTLDPKIVFPSEPSLQQLAEAIGKIKTVAGGTVTGLPQTGRVTVTGLPFIPTAIFVRITYTMSGNPYVVESAAYQSLDRFGTAETWFSEGTSGEHVADRPTTNSFAIDTAFTSGVTNISAEWVVLEGVGFFG